MVYAIGAGWIIYGDIQGVFEEVFLAEHIWGIHEDHEVEKDVFDSFAVHCLVFSISYLKPAKGGESRVNTKGKSG